MKPSIIAPAERKKQQGFSLIELMVVVIVLAILATAAIPFYRSFMTNQRIRTATFDMMALITFTRSEALKRNTNVTLNSNGASLTVTAGGPILKQQPMFTGIKLDCVDTTGGGHTYIACPVGGIIYNSSGKLVSQFKPLELYAVSASDTTSSYYRCITVDLSGRPAVKKGPC